MSKIPLWEGIKAPKDGSLCAYGKYFPEITDAGVNDMLVMTQVVINTHFAWVTDIDLIEDMVEESLVKMMEMLSSGTFDPSKGSLKNLFYTGARNSCKNCIYRSNKASPVEDSVMAINEAKDLIVTTNRIEIDLSKIFLPVSDDMKKKIASTLKFYGFIIDSDECKFYPETLRWCSFVVWRKLR